MFRSKYLDKINAKGANRRDFLKGLVAAPAAVALTKEFVAEPAPIVDPPAPPSGSGYTAVTTGSFATVGAMSTTGSFSSSAFTASSYNSYAPWGDGH